MRRDCQIAILLVFFSLFFHCLFAANKRSDRTIHLSNVTKIDGYYCKGWITTTKSGKLISFDSAAEIPMSTGVIPTGSRIVLFSNLKIQSVCLGKPTIIQGLPCIGYGPESPAISFYPDGKLRICYLTKETMIQGILCHPGTFSRVILAPDGRLLSCEMSKTQNIKGQIVKARSTVTLDDNGKVVHIRKSNKLRSLFFDALDKIL